MEDWKEAFVEIETKDDEKKWKAFFRTYFPNHYASGLLNEDLVSKLNKDDSFTVRIIAVGVDGFGLLSCMCLHYARSHYVRVADFEEFKQTDIYQQIIDNGPSLKVGEPRIIGNTSRRK